MRPPRVEVLELVEHQAAWARQAAWHMDRVRRALHDVVIEVHHVGATAVTGMDAAPVVDLVAEIDRLEALQSLRLRLSAFGFRAVEDGQRSLPRYEVEDLLTRRREIHLACYPVGHAAVREAVALRGWLRAHPAQAAEYTALRRRRIREAPGDLHAYAEAKARWLEQALPVALRFVVSQSA